MKEKILKEAQVLFWKYGVKSVTMDYISKNLGISKKTIYQYFLDKDKIVLEVILDYMRGQNEEVEEIFSSSQDSIHELFMLSSHITKTCGSIYPSLFYDLKKYHFNAYEIFQEHKRKCLLKSIIKNLQKGIEEGLYRKDINIMVIAKLRMEEIELGFNQEIFPSKDFKLNEVQIEFFNHFIYGITTVKGHKLLNKYKKINEEE